MSLKDQPENLVRFSIPLPPETMFTTTETAGPTSQLAVSPDGRELFYVSAERDLMSVKLQPGSPFAAGVPEKLFNLPVPTSRLRFRTITSRRRTASDS